MTPVNLRTPRTRQPHGVFRQAHRISLGPVAVAAATAAATAAAAGAASDSLGAAATAAAAGAASD